MIEKLENVTAIAKANVYFDGKVVSHTIYTAEGDRKTLGLFLPGDHRRCLPGTPSRNDRIYGDQGRRDFQPARQQQVRVPLLRTCPVRVFLHTTQLNGHKAKLPVLNEIL